MRELRCRYDLTTQNSCSCQALLACLRPCLSTECAVHHRLSNAFLVLITKQIVKRQEKTAQSCLLLLADIIDSILQALIISASRKAAMPHRGKKVPLSSQGHSRAVQSHHKALKPYMALQSQSFDISGML